MCEDKGFEHEDIILDVVLCSNDRLDEVNPKDLHPIQILARTNDINDYTKTLGDIEDIQHYLKKINIRYVVSPSAILASGKFPFQFKPEQIEAMIQLGEKDAKSVIGLGEGVHFKILQERKLQEKLRRFKNSNKDNTSKDNKFMK